MDLCWFCERNNSDPDCSIKVYISKIGHRDPSTGKSLGRRAFIRHENSVYVPRCEECAEIHGQMPIAGYVIPLVVLFLPASYCGLLFLISRVLEFVAGKDAAISAFFGDMIISAVISCWMVYILGRFLMRGRKKNKPLREAFKYPRVQNEKKLGWEIGSLTDGYNDQYLLYRRLGIF
jgi:hypothetical protein